MRGHGLAGMIAVFVAIGFPAPAGSSERGAVVFDGIERHAEQVSTVWGTHASVVGMALDGAVNSATHFVRETEEAKAVWAHSPAVGVCEGVERIRGATASRTLVATANHLGGDATVRWLVRDTVRAPDSSAPADLRARVDEVLARYCAPDRIVGAGAACRGAHEHHAADLRPEAVLGVGTFADERATITAIDWVRNIVLSQAVPVLAIRGARSVEDRRTVLAHRSRNARTALATGYLQGRVNARLPVPSDTDRATPRHAKNDEDARSKPSRHALLEALSRRRFEQPGYLARNHGESHANLFRELIVSEGISLMLAYEQYRDAERQGAMLAARLSQVVLSRARREP